MWTQIQSFIQSLGLDTKTYSKEKTKNPQSSVLQDNDVSSGECDDVKMTVDQSNNRPEKRKKKGNSKTDSEKDVSVGHQIDEDVSTQLLLLSVKSYKRLLVSMDSEAVWYDQVCHSLSVYYSQSNIM